MARKAETVTPLGSPQPLRVSRFGSLRSYFLTGLIVAGPVAITLYLTWSFIQWVDGWVTPFIPTRYLPETYLPFRIPGFGLIVAIIGLTLVGFLTANLVGRSLVRFGETLLDRMPVVRGIYKALKQVFTTVFSQSGTSFRKVGLVEFPQGAWSVVFISAEPSPAVERLLPGGAGQDWVSVFMPCAPNPTTGFFFLLPRAKVIELPISIEEGTKLVISAGLIQPESLAEPAPAFKTRLIGEMALADDREKA
ncbi:DUF502 domain-containing protein [Labrys wisconsinensis]|uniref:Membrane protein n=1 Tax=Labrys wisconsinensis TaxID=425677 RepID=A0ABU0J3H6_9HYPH|nr:DUF502 domain-containing protein [Labrys wisconsinensis]MDQ0468821.1 putative membrane protein [Labrys wisconsinensis]